MMEELEQAYLDAMPTIEQITDRYKGVSGPLFISVPNAYYKTSLPLMIVGQQTNGWPCVTEGLSQLLLTYREFNLGQNCTHFPFWRASHELFKSLNPEGPERAFLWSNLVKVDQHYKRPSAEVENSISGLNLLNRELEILKPCIVVFFTGPYYDDRLCQTFPGIRIDTITDNIAKLEHQELPSLSFRTYHPRYLRMAKKWSVLKTIVDLIKDRQVAGYTGR